MDGAPFQLVETTSIYKAHTLFGLLSLSHAYITNVGKLNSIACFMSPWKHNPLLLLVYSYKQGIMREDHLTQYVFLTLSSLLPGRLVGVVTLNEIQEVIEGRIDLQRDPQEPGVSSTQIHASFELDPQHIKHVQMKWGEENDQSRDLNNELWLVVYLV